LDTKTRKPKTDSPYEAGRLRIRSGLTADEERVTRETIGCAIDVHTEIGPGFPESIYHRGMCIALGTKALRFSTERQFEVSYRGHRVGLQRLDLLVEELVVVELKSVERLDFVHTAQVLSYLRASRLHAGVLFNVNAAPLLIRRVVL
jgi:GxxExxY protein